MVIKEIRKPQDSDSPSSTHTLIVQNVRLLERRNKSSKNRVEINLWIKGGRGRHIEDSECSYTEFITGD